MFLLPLLLYFSYWDIKTREIEDLLVYAVFWTGVLMNILDPNLPFSLVLTAVILIPLWLAGVFAQGDVWIGLIIAAFHPDNPFLGILSVVGAMILGALYGIVLLIKNNPKSWIKTFLKGATAGILASFHPLLVFLLVVIPDKFIWIFLPLVIFADWRVVALFGVMTVLWRAMWSGSSLTVEKEPEEGDIPAEIIDRDGKRYPMNLYTALKLLRGEIEPIHNTGADGLSPSDVERLKNLGIKKIRVKASLPLIPFIAAAYAFLSGYCLLFSCFPFLD